MLFTIWGQNRGNAVLSLDSGKWEMVLPTTTFASALVRRAHRFEGARAACCSSTIPRASEPRRSIRGARRPPVPTRRCSTTCYYDIETESRGWLAISTNGTAVYAAGNPARTSLVWVDREGKIEPLRRRSRTSYREVSISPDGAKAVVRQALNLWIHDLQRGTTFL